MDKLTPRHQRSAEDVDAGTTRNYERPTITTLGSLDSAAATPFSFSFSFDDGQQAAEEL